MSRRASKLLNLALRRVEPARGPLAGLVQLQESQPNALTRSRIATTSQNAGAGPQAIPTGSRVESWVRDQQAQQRAQEETVSSKAPSIDIPDWFLDNEDVLPEYGVPEARPVTASPRVNNWNVTEITELRAGTQTPVPSISYSPSSAQWDVGHAVEKQQTVRRALFQQPGSLVENNSSTNDISGNERLPEANFESSEDVDEMQINSSEISNLLDTSNPDNSFEILTVNAFPIGEITPTDAVKKRNNPPRKNVRKRTRETSEWAAQKAKKAFNEGKAHVTPKGLKKKARSMKPGCHIRCRKCKQRIPEQERERIFKHFWKLDTLHRKRDFITRSVSSKKPETCSTIPSRAKNSVRCYSLTVRSGDTEKKVIVCKKMFIETLDIPDCWVETAFKKCQGGYGQSPDKRGKHQNRPNKVQESTLASVRRHISSFARVPSHYTREKSKREYLEPHIKSVERMYKIYVNWAKVNNIEKIASINTYRKIFNREFNLGFFLPRKDQCEICNKWKNGKDNLERREIVSEYSTHLQNKKLVHKLKKEDKASASDLKCVACFDLQKVLPCPRSETSLFFYKNKLSLYNFTVFDLRLKEGHCYLWTEVDAHKGANEIGSNLYHFIKTKEEEGVKEFVFWSDSPTGQNRNRMIFSMFMLAAAKLQIKITHRFLESGHSYSEADSMHARIENEAERKEIFTPDEWVKLIEEAKQDGKQYIINRLETENVSDLHHLVDRQNWDRNTSNEQVHWSKVREVVTDSKSPNTVFYRYNFTEQLKTVTVTMKDRSILDLTAYTPPCAYQSKFPLSDKKKKDIQFLCRKQAIPSIYHSVFDEYLAV